MKKSFKERREMSKMRKNNFTIKKVIDLTDTALGKSSRRDKRASNSSHRLTESPYFEDIQIEEIENNENNPDNRKTLNQSSMFKLINMKEETNRGFFTNSALEQRPAFNTITPEHMGSGEKIQRIDLSQQNDREMVTSGSGNVY